MASPLNCLLTAQAGNTFLMLFAGHGRCIFPAIMILSFSRTAGLVDTTAHTLQAAIGLLGLYQDKQDDVFQQIMEVAPNDASELVRIDPPDIMTF